MEVHSASEFVVKVHEWEASLDPDCHDVLLGSEFMLGQYWGLAVYSKCDRQSLFCLYGQPTGFWVV